MEQEIPSQYEKLLDRLLDAQVLQEQDDLLSIGPKFDHDRNRHRERVDDLSTDELRKEFAPYVSGNPTDLDEIDRELLCDAMAVRDRLTDVDPEDAVQIAITIRRVDNPPRTSGAPDEFIPILGREIPGFLEQNPVSVLYFWREDCEQCDLLRGELEEMVADGVIDDRVGLAAIYGPDSATFLHEQYDVAVAPTVLFCADGGVDSRYVGAKYQSVLESEIEIIQESLPER